MTALCSVINVFPVFFKFLRLPKMIAVDFHSSPWPHCNVSGVSVAVLFNITANMVLVDDLLNQKSSLQHTSVHHTCKHKIVYMTWKYCYGWKYCCCEMQHVSSVHTMSLLFFFDKYTQKSMSLLYSHSTQYHLMFISSSLSFCICSLLCYLFHFFFYYHRMLALALCMIYRKELICHFCMFFAWMLFFYSETTYRTSVIFCAVSLCWLEVVRHSSFLSVPVRYNFQFI